MISRRIGVLLTTAILFLGLLAACTSQPTTEAIVKEPTIEQDAEAVITETQSEDPIKLDIHVRDEPPTLDPALAVDTTSIFFINQMFMGLTTFDEKSNVVEALATDWDASDDGLEWTFHLRDDVSWVRRDPESHTVEDFGSVTAQDVVYGVRRTLDPRTASPYAYVMYVIDGAEALNSADPTSDNIEALLDGLGVSAPDDTTVVFSLQQPAAYFPAIAGMWVAYPQPQQAIEQWDDKWTEVGNIVTNGAYTLSEWNHGASIEIEKNPLWVNAGDVQIDVVGGSIIQEASTAMALYENNEIDMMVDPPGWGPPAVDLDRIQSDPQLSQEYFTAPRLCTDFFGFVQSKPPFDDPLIRKAFAAAIDRTSLVENVTKGGEVPAHTFAPPGVFGNVVDNTDIGDYLVKANFTDQVAQAQAWLAEAGYPEGEGLDIIFGHDTAEEQARIASAAQAMWQEAFPKAVITIESQEWGVYLESLMPDSPDEGKPHIFRLGWCADYPDQNNWVNQVFHSQSGLNLMKYNNPDFDTIVEEAAFETDPAKRQELYSQAEEILINQDATIAPLYYQTYNRLYKPWITKVVINPLGGDPIAQWRIDWEAKKAARGQ